jgi:PAS domain S-box-containing protein/diguanylate cyclase (GGDEF)-like protein
MYVFTSQREMGCCYMDEKINSYLKERDFLRSVIDLIPAFISIKNEDGRFELVNDALSKAYGTTVQELEGLRDSDFSATKEEVDFFREKDLQAIRSKEPVLIEEEPLTGADGKVLWLSTKKVPIIEEDGSCHRILVVSNDITEQRKLEERLRLYAYHDDYTPILNRNGFREYVEPEIAHAREGACLVIIEVRHLNAIHSVYGTEFGDRILREIGETFLERQDQDFYGRIASDKFGIWMHQGDIDKIRGLVSDLKKALDKFIEEEGRYHQIEFAIGYTQDIHKEQNYEQLIQQVNATIEFGKKEKITEILCFEESIYEKLERNELLKSYVRRAITEDELLLYYQEKRDVNTGKVIGVEALARWFSKQLGYVSPVEFIPVFSQSKLIFDFTIWSLEKALQDYPKLKKKYHEDISVSVNISPLVIHTEEFYNRLISLTKHYHVDPHNITLEITEDIFINDLGIIIDIISRIRMLGFKISMDDFGSGYASINHLINLPFDEVKIDKSIIDLIETTVGKIFVENIIIITKELGALVVAEGVESESQIAILKQQKCDCIQGYYYSKPTSLD